MWHMSHARLAQSAERKTLNLVVVGSSPTLGASKMYEPLLVSSHVIFLVLGYLNRAFGIPTRTGRVLKFYMKTMILGVPWCLQPQKSVFRASLQNFYSRTMANDNQNTTEVKFWLDIQPLLEGRGRIADFILLRPSKGLSLQ